MLEMERKSYAYAETLLDKIHAYATDIGWMGSLQLFEKSKPKEERVIPYGTNSMSAADAINWLLSDAKKDQNLQSWFLEMDRRAVKELTPFGGHFENLLHSLHETMYNQDEEVLHRSIRLSLQVTSLCNLLKHRLFNEQKEVQNPITELLNYSGKK